MTLRLSTGLAWLDEALGGGLLQGSLTMVVGATGIGKTQLGIHFSQAGSNGESEAAFIDLSSRGDSQNHTGYSHRIAGRQLTLEPIDAPLQDPFTDGRPADVLPFLGYGGRRVLRSQMDVDDWHAWQSELNRRYPQLYRFVYSHLVSGTRRFIIDGIEPQAGADSLQLDLLEMIYHRMLRMEHDWLAREVFRQRFRELEPQIMRHAYDHQQSAAVVLVTTKQSMLDQLLAEPLADGDLSAGANTVIMLGRILAQGRMSRGLYIAKHRGSFADHRIINFDINETGLVDLKGS